MDARKENFLCYIEIKKKNMVLLDNNEMGDPGFTFI